MFLGQQVCLERCSTITFHGLWKTRAIPFSQGGNTAVNQWRRERDSNPRYRLPHIPTFQAGAFDHSATSPYKHNSPTSAAKSERDSNPRYRLPPLPIMANFPGWRLRPLGHLSVQTQQSNFSGKIREGFEPSIQVTPIADHGQLSRLAPSTTRPPLRTNTFNALPHLGSCGESLF